MSILNYNQRKALRRISRGQSIPGRMRVDPVISRCFTYPEIEPLPEDYNIVDYCDWESRVMSRGRLTVITPFGRELLAALDSDVDHTIPA